MHPNKAFRQTSTEDNLAFARERGFGVITLAGKNGPLASHIPFVLSDDATTFGAHLVRSNPILPLIREPQPALMVVSGADAYISPDWYAMDDQVPTWNYIAVHLRGTLRQLPDDALRPHLRALSAQFEQRLSKPAWTLDKMTPEALQKMEKFIAPVEFAVDSVTGTWKLGQNKPEPARLGAAQGLDDSDLGSMVETIATLMRDAQ